MTDAVGYETMFEGEAESGPSKQSQSQLQPSPDFSTSLAAWRDIQLPRVQKELLELSNASIELQKEALLSRKKLAEQTREYKKLTADEQPEASKPLLKAYQAEIDSLTKRAKAAESAVLSLRDRLENATDPYPVLEAVVEQVAIKGDLDNLNKEVARLRAVNAEFESQIASIPSLEAERSRLASKVRQLELSTQEVRKAVEAELMAKWDERMRNQKAREESLSSSLQTTQSQLKELRGSYAKVTERLLHHGEEVERGRSNGTAEELDVISEELTRSNERAAAMERRNEHLREEIERIKSGVGDSEKIAAAEGRAIDAEEESRRLGKALEEQSRKAAERESVRDAKIRDLERHLNEQQKESELHRRRIAEMADYSEIKRELEIFKYVEFANPDEQSDPSPTKPLEALLIEKNRHLQDELTAIRNAHQEKAVAAEKTDKELIDVRSESDRLKKLNERLENDLLNLNGSTKGSKSMSAEEALAELDSIGQGSVKKSSEPAAAAATSSSEQTSVAAAASSSSILPIITSQRDRFRARNAELEEELRKQFSTITELRNEVKTLQADNLSLYEKVRYLQAYNGNAGSSRIVNMTETASARAYPPTGQAASDKYREKYEASMNPFEQFRGREQSRAMNSLNPLERLLHVGTRVILGHRRMRIFFVIYAACLHILVFAMIAQVEFSSGTTIGQSR